MTERKKITALILFCIIILICLCAIQIRLVVNTFNLTREKYTTEIIKLVQDVENSPEAIKLLNQNNVDIEHLFYSYNTFKISRANFLKHLNVIRRGYEVEMRANMFGAAKNKLELKEISYTFSYSKVVLHNEHSRDTLMGEDKRIDLIRENLDEDNSISTLASNFADLGPRGEGVNISRYPRLSYQRNQFVIVKNWKGVVFWRMITQTTLAILIFLSMVYLFFVVIRTIIRQRKLGEMKTDFANNIAHELKTPLSSVGLIAKSLNRSEIRNDPDAVIELAMLLQKQQVKMELIFDRIMETTLAENNTVKMYKTDLTSFLNLYAQADPTVNITTFYHIEQGSCVIDTNTSIIETALDNLIENAKKYSDAGSKIKIRSYFVDSEYHIEISDEGRGIEKKHHKYIFEKFYRVSENNLHNVQGLGLGLFLSRTNLSKINADLRLKASSAEGSTFEIIFLP